MKYIVFATQTVTSSGTIEVDAASEEEAASIAEQSNEGWDWEDTDVSFEIGLIEGTEEDDEDEEDEE